MESTKAPGRDIIAIALDDTDKSEVAFNWTVKKLYKKGDLVKLLSVRVADYGDTTPHFAGSAVLGRVNDGSLKAAEILNHYAEICEKLSVSYETHSIRPLSEGPSSNDIANAIVKAVQDQGCDIVVMGCRGMGAVARTFLGSVGDALVHNTPCPVVICRQSLVAEIDLEQPRKLLLALDDSTESIAAFEWCMVHYLKPHDDVRVVSVDTGGNAEAAERTVDMYARRGAEHNIDIKKTVDVGPLNPTILKAAHEHGADVIIIGSRCLGYWKRAFLGSTGDYLIHESNFPVMIVKDNKATEKQAWCKLW